MDRREKALAQVDLNGRGLEIGPSYNALLPKSSGARIEIVDHATQAELIEKYRGLGVPADQIASIEEVDHVWKGGTLVDLIGEPGAFDYIVCSHAIEHMVDLIGFLQDCEALLREGGRLSLAIPDKRFCFDRLQTLTTVGNAIDGHLSGLRFHPLGSVIDHYANACQRGPGLITWGPETTTPFELQFPDLLSCRDIFEQARRQEEYVDVHRWRFTPTSFHLLLSDLRDLGYQRLVEVAAFDTAVSEFFVTLARPQFPPPREDRLTMLLRIEEELLSAVEPMVPATELQRWQEASAAELDGLRAASVAELQRREEASAAELERLRAVLYAREQRLSVCEQTLAGVLRSNSWRVTGPLRALAHLLRRQRQ